MKTRLKASHQVPAAVRRGRLSRASVNLVAFIFWREETMDEPRNSITRVSELGADTDGETLALWGLKPVIFLLEVIGDCTNHGEFTGGRREAVGVLLNEAKIKVFDTIAKMEELNMVPANKKGG
jgi:hypothetical protein